MIIKRLVTEISFVVLIFFLGLFLGYWIKSGPDNFNVSGSNSYPALRLGGYKYVNPLLVCDTDATRISPEFNVLENKVNQTIEAEKKLNNITTASVYFRELNTGRQFSVNPDEKYHPASLNKVPLMLAYYRLTRTNADILNKKIEVHLDQDYNAIQEIKPQDFAKDGEIYTVDQLIEKMIVDSDNNAYEILMKEVDSSEAQSAFADLKVPFQTVPEVVQSPADMDYMTAADYSYFLRVLYNGTYVRKELSEKALELLVKTDFHNGLVAGVPKNIDVAHKFGQIGFYHNGDQSQVIERELHDCGIIYHLRGPYLLCIMTKSTGQNSNIEKTLQKISTVVYKDVEANYPKN